MMAEQGVMTEQGMREQGDDDGGGGAVFVCEPSGSLYLSTRFKDQQMNK